jgi:phospholipase/lecithinase/hemolysin
MLFVFVDDIDHPGVAIHVISADAMYSVERVHCLIQFFVVLSGVCFE